MPSRHNKYIFNGDFVDRGSYGVEVMCTLLALHVAMPGESVSEWEWECKGVGGGNVMCVKCMSGRFWLLWVFNVHSL